MKLHYLKLKGIGPFRDEVTIDFASLGAAGTFLLEGPTGSGKSTVLDAIAFALYGNVAGEEASTERIRSHFSDPNEPSVVDLIVETPSGIFRVERRPQFERFKRRGTGTTTEHAKALLWKLSPEVLDDMIAGRAPGGAGADPLSSRIPEVTSILTNAIGLTREQFTQTVLLPQGEFQRFLRAKTTERQAVLTRVFGTGIFEQVEKELDERAKSANKRIQRVRDELRSAVDHLVTASGHEAAPELESAGSEDAGSEDAGSEGIGAERAGLVAAAEGRAEDGSAVEVEGAETDAAPLLRQPTLQERAQALEGEALRGDAAVIVKAVEQDAREAKTQAEQQRAREDAARKHLTTCEQRIAQIQRRRDLDALKEQLTQETPVREQQRARLIRHRALLGVCDALNRRDGAVAQQERMREALATLRDTVAGSYGDLAVMLDQNEPLTALAQVVTQETQNAAVLDSLVALEAGLAERVRQLGALDDACMQAQSELQALDEQIEARPQGRQNLHTQWQEARAAAEKAPQARQEEKTAHERHEAAKNAQNLAVALRKQEQTLREAKEKAEQAINAERELRRRRVQFLAADLADKLTEGEPCAVCGSREHPAPATAGEDRIRDEQVDAAEAERVRAEKAVAEASAAHTRAAERHANAVKEAEGRSVEQAQDVLQKAQEHRKKLDEEGRRATRLEADIQQFDQATETLKDNRSAQAEKLSRLTTQRTERREQLDKDRRALQEARGETASVAERRRSHEQRGKAASDLHAALDRLERATQVVTEREDEVAQAREKAAAALPSADQELLSQDEAIRGAILGQAILHEIEKDLEQHRINQSRLEDGMKEEGIEQTVGTAEAQAAAQRARDTAAAALQECIRRTSEAQSRAGDAAAVYRRTTEAVRLLENTLVTVERATAEAAPLLRMAELATGRTGDNLKLSTFVLMRRFEDVVAAANARLLRIGNGNLELQRGQGRGGNSKTGLDLTVIDRRTDQARLPDTLSGGETFYVSFALALGLSDVVSSEAGGVVLETLFIDEGFGSLDLERLDAVIQEIQEIAEGGRSVGIVSHVAELKTRIPNKISVRRQADATSTLSVTA